MTAPTHPGPWWAKGIGDNHDLGWQLFLVSEAVDTGQLVAKPVNDALVVRLTGAIHTTKPWFVPGADRWKDWTFVETPK